MELISRLITLDEMEMLREPLDQLHDYHNQKSTYFSGSYPRFSFEERVEQYRDQSKSSEYRIELLQDSETATIIGFCIANCSMDSGKIDVLFIDEKARGRGLGMQLMNNAMGWFNGKNINEIELTVVYGNEAVSFYEKLGFYPRSIIMTTK